MSVPDDPVPDDGDPSAPALTAVAVVAAVAGVGVGFVGGGFRWCLIRAAEWRIDLTHWAHDAPGPAWLVPVAVAAAGAAFARLVVRWLPLAGGSGIQHVEAVWHREVATPPLRLLPAKFVGGLAAIGSGLVLGREGPTVHMGAVIGAESGRRFRLADTDVRLLQTALAGAGLAVAFNAPIGGALFVFEEVTRSFRPRLVLATLIACATAVACSRLVLGDRPDFVVGPIGSPSAGMLIVFVVFGLLTGGLGVIYNRLVVGSLVLADRIRAVGPVTKAAVIGAAVGTALVVDPLVAGGGDGLTQLVLDGDRFLLPAVTGYLVVRFFAGPISYAAGTPGGLFAPVLAVGALWGTLFHGVLEGIVPGMGSSAAPLAIVGMAALFAAVVRAPFTGLVLIVEMTATTSLTVPLLAATFAATLATTLLRSPPIYDSLRERMLDEPHARGRPEDR